MASPTPLQGTYNRGMVRDVARHQLPKGAVWDTIDLIPGQLDAPTRKRGGWGDGGNLAAAVPGTISAKAVAYAPFSAGGRVVAVANGGRLVDMTGSPVDLGVCVIPKQEPVFYRNKLYIPDNSGSAVPTVYDGGGTTAVLTGAPSVRFLTSYKDMLVGAATVADPRIVYFPAAGDPTSWDTTNAWIRASFDLWGIAALQNMILLFGRSKVQRIIGSVAPPNSDMQKQDLFEVGCSDSRSIVVAEEQAIWANESGVFMTDGFAPENLTASAGLQSLWMDLMVGYDDQTWTIAGGYMRGFYFVNVLDGSNNLKGAFMFHLGARTGIQISNVKASMYARGFTSTGEQLFFANATSPHIGKLSQIFRPDASNALDGDGTPVLPEFSTSFFRPKPSKCHWQALWLGYMLVDDSTHNPTLEISVLNNLGSSTYRVIGTLPETTTMERKYRYLRFMSDSIAVRVRQTAASADTRIFDIEAELAPMEGNR